MYKRLAAGMMVVMMMLSSCGSGEEGLYRKSVTDIKEETASELTVQDQRVEEDEIIIEDELIALAGEADIEGFDFTRFTDQGNVAFTALKKDLEDNISETADQELYESICQIPYDDLMTVVSIDLEHMKQFDEGDWTDRRTEYANGKGYTVSSFSEDNALFTYKIRYNDNDGTYKVITVYYDSVLDRLDLSSESYSSEGIFGYAVRQQFCSDAEGGYYYQAVRQSLEEGTERVTFSHFRNDGYRIYIGPARNKRLLDAFSYDLFDSVPDSLETVIGDYKDLYMFLKEDGSFSYSE